MLAAASASAMSRGRRSPVAFTASSLPLLGCASRDIPFRLRLRASGLDCLGYFSFSLDERARHDGARTGLALSPGPARHDDEMEIQRLTPASAELRILTLPPEPRLSGGRHVDLLRRLISVV